MITIVTVIIIIIIIVSKRRLAELSHELSLAQKISLGLMWLIAAFFGVTACFPEKIFGNEMITDIEREVEEDLVTLASMEQRMVGEEVTVCSIKTGVDDFLDFLAVTVTLLIPTLTGTLHSERFISPFIGY